MSAADVSRVRGVGAEEDLDYTRAERRHIRRRSFRLLGELARPVRGTLLLTVVFVLVSNAARAAGPASIAGEAADAEVSTSSGRPSGRRMASTSISMPVASNTARCMAFSSSRTFPGQRCATIARLASADSGRAATPLAAAYFLTK